MSLSIKLNLEQSDMILRALEFLPIEDKKNVIHQKLTKDVETVKSIWIKRIKNQKIQEELNKNK